MKGKVNKLSTSNNATKKKEQIRGIWKGADFSYEDIEKVKAEWLKK
jgi:hypothetical protein